MVCSCWPRVGSDVGKTGSDPSCGSRDGQPVLKGMAYATVHFTAVPEADFDFGRVHIHIDPCRLHLDIQRINWLAVAMQHVRVGAASGVADDLVAHVAAIDIGKLLVGSAAGGIRDPGSAPHANQRRAVGSNSAAYII